VIRRAFALAASATVMTAAALTMALPASAHRSAVEGKADCDEATGNFVVTWTVSNLQRDKVATLKKVRLLPEGTTVTNIVEGATLAGGGELTGVQVVSADARGAALAVSVEWSNGKKHDAIGKVEFKDKCEKPTPTPTPTATETPAPTPTATPTATAPPGGGGGGDLPVTGAAVGGIVGAAAVLLAIGAGLFLLARRRRINFTA
jgi:LPXTG-motif cell wall-anchored protein